jgi:hypothetical protein
MLRWVRDLVSRIFGKRSPVLEPVAPQWSRPRFDVPRFSGDVAIPPMHWKSCHPATIRRFKAEFACPNGHGIVLKGHSIDPDGTVHPSVVCPAVGCDFHDFVRLSRWDAGAV